MVLFYFLTSVISADEKLKWVPMQNDLLQKKWALFEQYAEFITPERRDKLITNAQQRTNYLTVVLEDIYTAHNISAVLRSCDCFGIQNVHIIEQKHTFAVTQEIVKGAAQWLSINTYSQRDGKDTGRCFQDLRDEGYTIVATTPHKDDVLIQDLPIDKKIALVFGTEKEGLSSYALEKADAYVKVPLYGFTESFNISVCAGIALYELIKRLRESSTLWPLSENERIDLLLSWLSKTTTFGDQINQQLEKLTSE